MMETSGPKPGEGIQAWGGVVEEWIVRRKLPLGLSHPGPWLTCDKRKVATQASEATQPSALPNPLTYGSHMAL